MTNLIALLRLVHHNPLHKNVPYISSRIMNSISLMAIHPMVQVIAFSPRGGNIQEILKPKSSIVVFIDYREGKSVVTNILRSKGVDVRLIDLEVGDYVISDAVCIERKTFKDFVSSVIDGRVFRQARVMKEYYERPIILIEGEGDQKGVDPNALRAAMASLIIDLEVYVLQTRNQNETASLIYWLARREQEEKKRRLVFKRRSKKPKNVREIQEYIVSGLPGISDVLARRLLKNFGSVRKIFEASEGELIKVKGIGKGLARRIVSIVSRKYGE